MNCVFIVIDGLGEKDLPWVREVCPNLRKLISGGERYENVYANGCPTEFALPGLFASNWLLNDADRYAGLARKKLTAAEYFESKSYAAGSFSPVYRPASNGYRRGYSHFYNPYCPRTLAKEIDQNANWFLDEYLSGRLPYESFEQNVVDLLKESLGGLAGLDPYYEVDAGLVESLRAELQEQPSRVVENFSRTKKLRILDILNDRIKNKVMSQRNKASALFLYAVMAVMAFVFGGTQRLKLGYAGIVRLFGARRSESKFSSAKTLVDEYLDWLRHQTKPTFSFLHLLDFHEKNYFSFETGAIEKEWLSKLLKFLFANRGRMDKIHHLMSLLYLDDQIQRIVAALEQRGDYRVVLTSDHGNIDFSKDKHVFHKTFDFSDLYYRVPLVICKPGSVGSTNKNLGSSIDVIPTLVWDLFSEQDSRFSGVPLQNGARDYVFYENTGRGPTDLSLKPVYIALKRETVKLKFRFHLSSNGDQGPVLSGDLLDARDDKDKALSFSVATPDDMTAIVARVKEIFVGLGKHPNLTRLRVGSVSHEFS